MTTKIEWTDETWNPVSGCTKKSEGCRNCYAERMSKRLAGRFGYPEKPNAFDVTLHPNRLADPLHWDKPRKVFVCSMGDLFHEDVPNEYIERVFKIMKRSTVSQHIFQILTKRPERMKSLMSNVNKDWTGERPLWNVWLGVSVEDQAAALSRIPPLLDTFASHRFVSCEPLLGDLILDTGVYGHTRFWIDCLDWVIAGGESGPGARCPDPDWFRSIRDQCVEAGVPFFFKQWGGPHKKGWVINEKIYSGRTLDGEIWDQYPGAVKK